MVIYQILDEQDYPVDDYLDLVVAVQTEEDLKHWQLAHDYQEENINFKEDMSWIGAA